MYNIARFAHLLGFALLLGSVLAFAAASGVPAAGDLQALAVARRVISAGTNYVTLPGLALLVVSAAWLIAARPGTLRSPWTRLMTAAGLLIVANTILIVLPAVGSATRLAQGSAGAGELAPGYWRAYMTESVAGGVNILLALAAMGAGISRFGARAATHAEQDKRRAESA